MGVKSLETGVDTHTHTHILNQGKANCLVRCSSLELEAGDATTSNLSLYNPRVPEEASVNICKHIVHIGLKFFSSSYVNKEVNIYLQADFPCPTRSKP